MIEFASGDELDRFERKWKSVFTCFAVVLAGALFDYMLRSPNGVELAWCFSLGALSFIVCLWCAYKLQDPERLDGLKSGLSTLDEDLSPGDCDG